MAYDRKDHLYEKAKSEGYASRAAYKLKELQRIGKSIFSLRAAKSYRDSSLKEV